MLTRNTCFAVLALLVAATAAQALPLYGTDGAAIGGWNYVDSNGTHVGPNFRCDFVVPGSTSWCGPNFRSFDATFAVASLDQQLGLMSTSVSVSNPAGSGYRLRTVQATTQGAWWDTFTLTSSTLPAGTLADVRVRVDLTGIRVQPSIGAPAPYTRIQANISLGGPDAPWVAGLSLTNPGQGTSTGVQQFALGSTFTYFGDIFATTETDLDLLGDYGEATGTAHYYIDVLTPGVQIQSASGYDYSSTASVPEPSTAVLLLVSLLGVPKVLKLRPRR